MVWRTVLLDPHDLSASDELTDIEEEIPDDISPLRADVGPDQVGQRLDRCLSDWLTEHSRARLQRWIEEGAVLVNGQVVRPSRLLRLNDKIEVCPPAADPQGEWIAEALPLTICFEDDDVLVIDKPAGLVVHPAAGHPCGTLLNGLLFYCPALRHVPRAGIVHRLDRDTTGLMAVAKTLQAQTELVRQLQARTVRRIYLALAWGRLEGSRSVAANIGRDPTDRQRMAVVAEHHGKAAVTHFKALGIGSLAGRPITLLECRLETGRTHQIRVHLQSIGMPIVGDQTYHQGAPRGPAPAGLSRQALHATLLEFDHPRSKVALTQKAPPPPDFQAAAVAAGISPDRLAHD